MNLLDILQPRRVRAKGARTVINNGLSRQALANESRAEAMRRRHLDPEFQKIVRAAGKKSMAAHNANPEFRKKLSKLGRAFMLKMNQDPEFTRKRLTPTRKRRPAKAAP